MILLTELIQLSNGSWIRAYNLSEGDYVITYKELTEIIDTFKVNEVHTKILHSLEVLFTDGTTLSASREHCVKQGKRWVYLEDLRKGDIVTGVEHELVVKEIKDLGRQKVVSIDIEKAHTYIVNGILSHS